MPAVYLSFNCNQVLACKISFLDQWRHSRLTTSVCELNNLFFLVFIAQINHCGKIAALRKLILIILQLTNQIK